MNSGSESPDHFGNDMGHRNGKQNFEMKPLRGMKLRRNFNLVYDV